MEIIKPIRGRQLNKTHPLNRGLVGCWLFNEGSGSRAFDLSGNGNHGTLQEFASPPTDVSGWNAGRKGTSLSFDGVNDYVNCGNGESLNITNAITIEAWVKNNALNVRKIWSSKAYGDTDSDSEWWMEWSSTNKLRFLIWNSSSVNYTVETSEAFDGNWHHIVGTYDKDAGIDNLKIYVDGALKGFNTATGQLQTSANQPVILGTIGAWTSNSFKGIIDEVRIYNRVLTQNEIMQLYLNPYCMF